MFMYMYVEEFQPYLAHLPLHRSNFVTRSGHLSEVGGELNKAGIPLHIYVHGNGCSWKYTFLLNQT